MLAPNILWVITMEVASIIFVAAAFFFGGGGICASCSLHILLLLPLALQPAVGFGLSKNTSQFFPIYHQLSPSSRSQHLKISFYFFSA
jgi:hypothetical protein